MPKKEELIECILETDAWLSTTRKILADEETGLTDGRISDIGKLGELYVKILANQFALKKMLIELYGVIVETEN